MISNPIFELINEKTASQKFNDQKKKNGEIKEKNYHHFKPNPRKKNREYFCAPTEQVFCISNGKNEQFERVGRSSEGNDASFGSIEERFP